MVDWQSIYHRSPYPFRVLAASVRGYYLRRWRYGPETERLVEEAVERENWSRDRWKEWLEERCVRMLHRAATRVPFYRRLWQERRSRGDRASWEDLDHWPVLEKESLRRDPGAFVADDCDPKHMFHLHTSGTTGTPVQIWATKDSLRQWYALHETRVRRWNGVDQSDRWAMIGGQLVAAHHQTRPPFWVWNHGLRQLYLSSYHLAPQYIPAYVEAMMKHRVEYILGYPSSLYALAKVTMERRLEMPRLKVAIANAEPLLPHQRAAIEHAFDCPSRETYGMAEMVVGASECAEGRMHLWPDAGVVEVWREDLPEPAPSGQIGRILCTTLLNLDMPLIRYEVGDRGALAPPESTCECGRELPVLECIEGRLDDVIRTPDGRAIGRLDPVFKAELPIREAQIVQQTLDSIQVRVVPAEGYSPEHGREIAARLRERVGNMEIDVAVVDSIPRTANGKVRSVISLIAHNP